MNNNRPALKILFCLGRPLGPLYGALMTLRAFLYRVGIFKQHRLPVPVISVGNLHLGGTGKTPLIKYIAELLQRRGRKPAILSRGYRGRARGPINVVSDGHQILMSARECGDEPRLLAEALAGVPVITGKKRAICGHYAVDHLQVDTLLLDDAFQHLAIARDLNLVLFNAAKSITADRIFPAGELREPVTALHRADGLVITGIDNSNSRRAEQIKTFLTTCFPGKPIFTAAYKAVGPLTDGRGRSFSLAEARRLSFFAFCGIANPSSFLRTLAAQNFRLAGSAAFQDHHAYTTRDIDLLKQQAKSRKAQALITTEKDFVKIGPFLTDDPPVFALKIELVIEDGFEYFLLERIGRN